MAGVFFSYSRADRVLAERMIRGLRGLGVQVWWDEDMPGVDWQEELERQIGSLAAVLVLWTPVSTASKHVRDEARLALESEKLVNALVGVPRPPFPYDRVNGLPLDAWTGREPSRGWTRLIGTLEEHLVRAGTVQPGALTAALTANEQSIATARAALEAAELAFQEAKAGEDEAETIAGAARANLARAGDQLQRVAELKASSAVIRTAQAEVDEARDAAATVDEARRAAASRVSSASRALATAKGDLARLLDEPVTAPRPLPAPEATAPEDGVRPTRRPHRTAPPLPKRSGRPVAYMAAGAVGAVLALGVALVVPRHPPGPATTASGATADSDDRSSDADDDASSGQVSSGQVSSDQASGQVPLASMSPRAAMLAGEWSGNGATCDDSPVRIKVKAGVVSMGVGIASTEGTIEGEDANGAVRVRWSDGVWSYARNGDALTMTPPRGASLVYHLCAD